MWVLQKYVGRLSEILARSYPGHIIHCIILLLRLISYTFWFFFSVLNTILATFWLNILSLLVCIMQKLFTNGQLTLWSSSLWYNHFPYVRCELLCVCPQDPWGRGRTRNRSCNVLCDGGECLSLNILPRLFVYIALKTFYHSTSLFICIYFYLLRSLL